MLKSLYSITLKMELLYSIRYFSTTIPTLSKITIQDFAILFFILVKYFPRSIFLLNLLHTTVYTRQKYAKLAKMSTRMEKI
jgi:hypothetical protein